MLSEKLSGLIRLEVESRLEDYAITCETRRARLAISQLDEMT
jgi:hypothetical protein